jgi:hypothetical protein
LRILGRRQHPWLIYRIEFDPVPVTPGITAAESTDRDHPDTGDKKAIK